MCTYKHTIETKAYSNPRDLESRLSIYDYTVPSYKVHEIVPRLLGLGGNETILDVGCGNGRLLLNLAKHKHKGRLYGIDVSEGVFEKAKKYSQNNDLKIHFVAGDSQQIPFLSDAFDAVTACHMIYHVPNMKFAISEMRRVLKPGGKFVLSANSYNTKNLHIQRWKRMVANEFCFDSYPKIDERFNIENGEKLVKQQFPNSQLSTYKSKIIAPMQIFLDYFDSMRSLWSRSFSDEEWQEIHNFVNNIALTEQHDGIIEENNIFGIFFAIK